MKVTVFGATGKIGRLVIARLSTVAGKLSDALGARRAVVGAEAVISALGPSVNRVCNKRG